MLYFFVYFLCMYALLYSHIQKRKCIYFSEQNILLLLLLYYLHTPVWIYAWLNSSKMQDAKLSWIMFLHYNCSATIWSSSIRFIIAKQIKLLATARIIICVQFHGVFISNNKFHIFKYAYSVSIGFFAMHGFVLSWQEFHVIRAGYRLTAP